MPLPWFWLLPKTEIPAKHPGTTYYLSGQVQTPWPLRPSCLVVPPPLPPLGRGSPPLSAGSAARAVPAQAPPLGQKPLWGEPQAQAPFHPRAGTPAGLGSRVSPRDPLSTRNAAARPHLSSPPMVVQTKWHAEGLSLAGFCRKSPIQKILMNDVESHFELFLNRDNFRESLIMVASQEMENADNQRRTHLDCREGKPRLTPLALL